MYRAALAVPFRRALAWRVLAVMLPALLAACASQGLRSRADLLDETLRAYAGAIRWGDIGAADVFLEPSVRETLGPSALERARYQQVQVSTYEEQGRVPSGDNEVRQSVRIELVNVNTQRSRSVVDHQVWRWDDKTRRWWLVSGLPDITQGQ